MKSMLASKIYLCEGSSKVYHFERDSAGILTHLIISLQCAFREYYSYRMAAQMGNKRTRRSQTMPMKQK